MDGFILTIKNPSEVEKKFSVIKNYVSNFKIIVGDESMLDKNDFNQEVANLVYGRDLRKGEVYCSLGHRLIYKLAAKNEKWSLVLEDDAILEEKILDFLSILENFKVDEPTIILLGQSKTIKENLWFQNFKQPMFNKILIDKFILGERAVDLVGTVGYLINGKAARIISENKICFWKADHWSLFQNIGIKILHLKHPLVWEDFLNKNSSTMNSNEIQHNLFSKRFVTELGSAVLMQLRRIR